MIVQAIHSPSSGLVFVEGRPGSTSGKIATKQNCSRLKVTAERVQFLDTRGRDDAGGTHAVAGPDGAHAVRPLTTAAGPAGQPPASRPPQAAAAAAEAEPQMPESPDAEEGAVDDIPF